MLTTGYKHLDTNCPKLMHSSNANEYVYMRFLTSQRSDSSGKTLTSVLDAYSKDSFRLGLSRSAHSVQLLVRVHVFVGFFFGKNVHAN